MKTKIYILLLIVATILGAGFYFLRPYVFHGTVIQSSDPAFDFTLSSARGNVSLSDYRGKLILIYFGYTNCVDLCPATLANIGQALRKIGTKADDIQTIMISLDPDRDTPEILASYVMHFYPSFIGVTGTKDQLEEITTLYGIYYDKTGNIDNMDYMLDHTSTLLVIDRDGYLKLTYAFGVTAEEIAGDLKYMLRQ